MTMCRWMYAVRSKTVYRCTALTILAFSSVVTSAPAGAGEAVRDHEIAADDYFSIGVITDCVMSPDGRQVAYTELRWEPPNEDRNLDLWVVESESKEVSRLTFDPAADGDPQWSPDGRWIYFTSSRKLAGEENPPYNGKKQVWRVSPRGGPPQAVTRVKDGIDHYELARDGRMLYYTVGAENTEDEWKDLRQEFKDLHYGHGVVKVTQLFKLDLVNWRSEKLVDEKRTIRSFTVSPDQRRIAMITTPDELLITNEGQSRVDVYDAHTKEITPLPDQAWREQAPSPYGWIESPAWAQDSGALAFKVDFDGYPTEVFVAEWPEPSAPGEESVAIYKMKRPNQISVTGPRLQWRGQTRDLCFVAEEHARARVYRVSNVRGGQQGPAPAMTPGDVVAHTFSLSDAGDRLAAVISTVSHPPDVFALAANRPQPAYDRLTRANPQVDTWKLPTIEAVSWRAPDGVEVGGILELPPGHQAGQKLPLVVELHGGPTAASLLHMRFWIYGRVLWSARGYALLSPNYRGSTGYGDPFLTDLIGHENDREVADILASVDAMIQRGIADPDRLGVMGWSNGGYLANCLITQTDRFKVASSGAGILDMAMQWGIEDTPGHVINYQRGFPWSQADLMRAASPLYNLDKVKTPTIIHVGEQDTRCPPAHSRALYRALHEYLGVPTELIVYPGQGHSLTTYTTRKAKLAWDLAWFERYLPVEIKPETGPAPEAENKVEPSPGN